MKRCQQLQDLSREHHQSLVMSKNIAEIADHGDDDAIAQAIKTVTDYYDSELELHFQHEEQTIFSLIFKQYKEHIPIATALLKEHGFMRMLMKRISPETAREDLSDFAILLKNHTRQEERELFPIIEALFTDEQLEAVLNFEPLD